MSLNRRIANLGKVIDSGATGHFLSKGDSDGQFSTVAYSSIVGTPTVLDSALTSQLVDSSYIQLRQTVGTAGLDSALITTLVDSSYVVARAGSGAGAGFVKYQYTATANQTTFQDSASDGAILAYTEDYIQVYYNGVVLPSADYTATSGTSVVLGTGADSGAILSVAKWAAPSSGGGGAAAWKGSRGILWGGIYNNDAGSEVGYEIEYISIASPGNATSFGDLNDQVKHGQGGGSLSDGTYGVLPSKATNASNRIQYITVATAGNAADFGDMTTETRGHGTASNGTLGLIAGGRDDAAIHTAIEYITIATPGNATSSGTLSIAPWATAGVSNGTLGMFGCGYNGGASSFTANVDYVTIATSGNGTSWGNLTAAGTGRASADDGTYGVWMGGNVSGQSNVCDYLTIATSGSASDFGDLTVARYMCAGAGDGTYGICAGGVQSKQNVIDYVTIASPGNATDFGDMGQSVEAPSGCSGT